MWLVTKECIFVETLLSLRAKVFPRTAQDSTLYLIYSRHHVLQIAHPKSELYAGRYTKLKRTHRSPSSIADPDPGSGAFLTPGSGIRDGKKSRARIQDPESGILDRGSRINIPDPQHCLKDKQSPSPIIWDRVEVSFSHTSAIIRLTEVTCQNCIKHKLKSLSNSFIS